ncbi:hypothetical protein TSMEX_007198 [Taenia solium]|eukprot:TsM_001240000 transcript=TsM_001240000 gene=TsM_001240000
MSKAHYRLQREPPRDMCSESIYTRGMQTRQSLNHLRTMLCFTLARPLLLVLLCIFVCANQYFVTASPYFGFSSAFATFIPNCLLVPTSHPAVLETSKDHSR